MVLPNRTRELADSVGPAQRHAGLQLDKFSTAGEQKEQKRQIERVTKSRGDQTLLDQVSKHRHQVLAELRARRFCGKTNGPLTLHLSRSGALENAGIALHPIYGFAWLPGTGIKGMVRAWAETVWAPEQPDRQLAWARIRTVFGTAPGSEKGKTWAPEGIGPPAAAAAGRIVFHDAWPVRWPGLEADIVNNHHQQYYAGENDPGDWEDPTMVSFLAVGAGTEFDFAISDRAPADRESADRESADRESVERESAGDGLAELAEQWLRSALAHAGAGAKTAAGYGRIVPVEGPPPAAPKGPARSEHRLELVTPAFLAGSKQGCKDCDLRPATLRGLLRWWWRTMHAAQLRRSDLLALETAIWGSAKAGSAKAGSAIAIAVAPEAIGEPVHYQFKDRFKPRDDFVRAHDLKPPPHGRKTTQGLFYASYGMDEGHGEKRQSRWFRQPGARWHLTLTARNGRFNDETAIPAALVLKQAEAALWLFARFGGAGSKARKGFGSFTDLTEVGAVRTVRTVEDCLASGSELRRKCCLDDSRPAAAPTSDGSSLKNRIETTIETPWRDPWTALDQLGYAYQEFAKSGLDDGQRTALGLPRRVGGGRGRPLGAKMGSRHASPAHWSLSKRTDGRLTVRLIAFPAARLPDLQTSRTLLEKLKEHAEHDLKERSRTHPEIGQNPPPTVSAVGPSVSVSLPSPGERVGAVLLEAKTKKGGWKAQMVGDGPEGSIFNSHEVPAGSKAGQEVELIVKSSSRQSTQFEWPSAGADPPRDSRRPQRQGSPGRGREGHRGGGRRRRR